MSETIATDVLLEAVAQCLSDDILPGLADERERYLLRVCISALGMARRDLAMPPGQAEAEHLALRQLVQDPLKIPLQQARPVEGLSDAHLLAKRLRAGDIPVNALNVLKSLTASRAARANPKARR